MRGNRVVLTVDWRLPAQLFKHFRSTGESIAGLADRDVQHEFLDAKFPHGILVFGLGLYLRRNQRQECPFL